MSNNKKVFSITINGVNESIDAVKSLNAQLRECEGIIKNLQSAKIDVKVSAGTKTTQKVGSGKTSDSDKVALDIEKEKTKQIEMQNDALRQQYVQREQLKQQNKEALEDIKNEAKGYIEVNDGAREYANTLNGMSAELKDIKSQLRNTDIGSELFQELTDKAAALNEKLKSAEMAYGQFGRNVGNYTQSILDALEEWDENNEFSMNLDVTGAEGSLKDLQAQLKELKHYWSYMSPDDKDFDKTTKAIKSLTEQIQDMESSIKSTGDESNTMFTGRFTTTINGVEASFSNASEACEALRKKLVAMRVAGEQNTPMYQEIIQLTRKLAKEVKTANSQVEGMTQSTANMGKVIGVMKGLSGIAALGQGIAGLFGGASEDLDKFIKRFASLTLVIAGFKELQELIEKGEGAWGKFAKGMDNALNSMTNGLQKVSDAIDAMKKLEELRARVNDTNLGQSWADLGNEISIVTNNCKEFADIQSGLFDNGGFQALDTQGLDLFNQKVEELKNNFPQLADKIDEYIEKSKELNKANEDFNNILSELNPLQFKLVKGLGNLGKAGKVAGVGLQAVAIGIKAVMKATIIMIAIQVLADMVEKLTDVLGACFDKLKSFFGIMSDSSAKKLAQDVDTLANKLDSLSKEYDIKIKLGNLGDAEAQLQRLEDRLQHIADIKRLFESQDEMSEWMGEVRDNLDETDKAFQKLNDTEKDAARAMKELAKIDPVSFEKIKNMKPQDQLKEIEKALGGNVETLGSLQTILSQDDEAIGKFLDKLSDIDWDLNDIGTEGVKAFGKLGEAINKVRDDAASAVNKINGDLKTLKDQNINMQMQLDPTNFKLAFSQAMSSMATLAKSYGITMSNNGMKFTAKEGDNVGAELAKQMEENAKLQKQITQKQIDDKKKQEADRAKQELERQKQEAKKKQQLQRNFDNARIEAMKDSYDKEMAMLKQKRKEELEDAEETGKGVMNINALYDRLELELKKKYQKFKEDAQKEHNKRLMDIAKDFLSQWINIQRQIEDTKADTSMGQATNSNIQIKQNISYDTNTSGADNAKAQQGYYKELLNAEIQYINEKEKLEIEASKREQQRLIEDEKARIQSEKDAQKEALDQLKESLDAKVEAGQISQEDANRMYAETAEAYYNDEDERLKQHYDNIAAITENGETVRKNIELQAQDERQQATIQALDNQLSATEEFYDKIDKVMERTQKRKTNQFGFIDYGSYKKLLKDALDSTKEVARQIEEQKVQLQEKLNNKEISFEDFQKANKQLDDFAEEVKDKTKELQDNLSGSFNSWLGNVMEGINQYTSVLSGMFDTLNEMYTRQLDAEEEALDKKQELLDKELEMIEENLQKQQEVTEQHKDKINDVEGQLKDARGDRRQALIDQLAAEKKAMEDSIKQEKKVTEEKKKNQAKQEQLKKQQDALDKKRKQQEKRSAIVQATINTFTAVSNALAVQPWFVGLALSAVALGLGLANVAQISSQKYADGGLLNGKPHRQGGMKIQGSNIEVEGGEYVTNKASTASNLPLLEYINSNRRTLTRDDLMRFYDNGSTPTINRQMKTKFEEGGQIPQMSVDVNRIMNGVRDQNEDKQLVVSVVDIINSMENVNQVRVLAGDVNND